MEVFVFGSNLAGRHGKGAAKTALEEYGAEYGEGVGFYGCSYAIPTKDERIQTLPLERIALYVEMFIHFAEEHSDIDFNVTAIGTGLAGYTAEQIAPMFRKAPANCRLPEEFKRVLK